MIGFNVYQSVCLFAYYDLHYAAHSPMCPSNSSDPARDRSALLPSTDSYFVLLANWCLFLDDRIPCDFRALANTLWTIANRRRSFCVNVVSSVCTAQSKILVYLLFGDKCPRTILLLYFHSTKLSVCEKCHPRWQRERTEWHKYACAMNHLIFIHRSTVNVQ